MHYKNSLMVLSGSRARNTRIALSPGVFHFMSYDGSLLVKHGNRLYKISARSDMTELTKLLRMLKRQKKIKEIINRLSGFKTTDVIGILETLHDMKLITLLENGNKKIKDNSLHPKNIPWDKIDTRNDTALHDLELVLIGDGLLASKLGTQLKNMKIKFNRVKSSEIVTKSS